jgi:hypothetical protein
MTMLDMKTDNTIAPAAVAWANAIRIDVDRVPWERWSECIEGGDPWEDGGPAPGATLLASGHHFMTAVVYQDDTWHAIGWSDTKDDLTGFAAELARNKGLPLNFSLAMAAYVRALN